MKSNKVRKVWDLLKKSVFVNSLDDAKVDEENMTSEDLSTIISQLLKKKRSF